MTQRTRADSPTKTCTSDGCDRPLRARGLCSMHYRRVRGRKRYPITCQTCGEPWMSARPDGRFCSDQCKGAAYRFEKRSPRELVYVGPAYPVTWLPSKHPVMQNPKAPRPHTWFMGWCQWCGDAFTDWQPAARYCSRRCGDAAVDQRSRLRRGRGHWRSKVTKANRLAIYKRDGWVCHICNTRVDQELMNSDANADFAPSLDHVVPVSQGGSDQPSNLRLAHRWCNSMRSDATEFTALVVA